MLYKVAFCGLSCEKGELSEPPRTPLATGLLYVAIVKYASSFYLDQCILALLAPPAASSCHNEGRFNTIH